jgi:hypothetical protein
MAKFHASVHVSGLLRTAVNRNLVTALNQADRDFFRERFETSVPGRDAPGSEKGDAH